MPNVGSSYRSRVVELCDSTFFKQLNTVYLIDSSAFQVGKYRGDSMVSRLIMATVHIFPFSNTCSIIIYRVSPQALRGRYDLAERSWTDAIDGLCSTLVSTPTVQYPGAPGRNWGLIHVLGWIFRSARSER